MFDSMRENDVVTMAQRGGVAFRQFPTVQLDLDNRLLSSDAWRWGIEVRTAVARQLEAAGGAR